MSAGPLFLSSPRRRRNRLAKNAGGDRIRRIACQRFDNHCSYCGQQLSSDLIHFDHVFPVIYGGPSVAENIMASCRSCNVIKSARPLSYLRIVLAWGSMKLPAYTAPLVMERLHAAGLLAIPRPVYQFHFEKAGYQLPAEVREWSDRPVDLSLLDPFPIRGRLYGDPLEENAAISRALRGSAVVMRAGG